jgi:3-oxoacyl-[acyl-carrier-protein] synthase-1
MNQVFAISDHILCALGTDSESVWNEMLKGHTGVKKIEDQRLFPEVFWAALVDNTQFDKAYKDSIIKGEHTRFEKFCLLTALGALQQSRINPASDETLFILSSTKGNIDLMEKKQAGHYEADRLFMWHTARLVCDFFRNPNQPVIISNACISGVLALITAHDYLSRGLYKNAVVIGADIASEFVISGFQSFKSLSNGPCKPFDAQRDGLNLGEGAACIVLSSDEAMLNEGPVLQVCGGGSANDANHISGPSRTGEGLYLAVQKAMEVSQTKAQEVNFISAHGTATPFNDEMESKAFAWAGLSETYLNSMKGYFGHTLGAAGVIETAICLHSMRSNLLLKTLGFSEYGVPEKVNVLAQNTETPVHCCLKTASGFGGCNAAIMIKKSAR